TAAAATTDERALGRAVHSLSEGVRRLRMRPFVEGCEGLDRVVRDLTRASGKEVELVVEGGTVELDRAILEALADPLRHLVRNAVAHGVEPVDERLRAGKPRRARLTVSAAPRGAEVDVAVADDGRGIDLERVRAVLRRRGDAEPTDEQHLAHAVFEPG